MSQQHTPEPMFQYEYRQLATYEDGRTPALLTEEQYRRARACVNACAGIPTEELERQCSSRYIVSKTDLVRMVNEATKQRDELLEALDMCKAIGDWTELHKHVNAAIASVKGEV